jgi:3-dehydroquinate dehydratase / shikimate dehydrogenase
VPFLRIELLVIFAGKICAVVAATDAGAMWAQVERALRTRHAGSPKISPTVELRLDWLKDDTEIGRFLRKVREAKPRAVLLATCRRRMAGGKYRGSIAKQLLQLAEALRAGCAWYDLEIETIRECSAELLDVLLGAGKRLASAHFFDRTPSDLDRVVRELWATRSHAIKVAARSESLANGLKVLRLTRGKQNVVAVPMGDVALPLRILSVREGSALSYAPVEKATAPGQIALAEMEGVYRAGRLDRGTRVYGIIGDPIAHSISPAMHNAAFHVRRMNAVYVPFLVNELPDFLSAIRPLGVRGFSVTLPHKEAMLRYLDRSDPLAAEIGAVNTVAVRGGKLYGYNTDYIGVLRALEPHMQLRGSRILIVGAGGAARAAAFALARAGASIFIGSRRKKRTAELVKAVGGQAIGWEQSRHGAFDAIVNATPIGMHPFVQDSPLDARDLNCRVVFDMIYRPQETRLLKLAAQRGIETVPGIEMLVAQGIAQWEIWTGRRAPASVMRRAAIRALEHA